MQSLILAFASGLIIEIMQTILRVGIFDIDDVILNALGVMIGYWIFLVLTRWLRERKYTYIVVAVLIVIAACAGALYEIYPHGEELVIPQQGADLCGGTHGTGEIISKGEHTITIRRNDGTIQTFKITEQTEIKSSAGTITEADLKVGDRATLVVYDNETATGIFVCGRGF
jgi:hypothetical protein